MDTLMHDLRQGVRRLAKARLFTAVAIASLALGIGANVTVFTIVNALAFRPLPYTEPDRLVDVSEWSATRLCDGCGVGTSYDGFNDWRAAARSFTGMGAYVERPFAVSGTETAERIGGALVSAEVFDLLGVHPAIGRGFLPEDDREGAPPVVLLGDALWSRRYAADRRIVGQTIRVNGVAHTVIGVMPPRFRFPEFADLWVPFTPNAAGTPRDQRDYGVVARLRPGVTTAAADAEMATIAKRLAARYPETQTEWTARVVSFRSNFEAIPQSMLLVLLGAVAFVLLIVCANLAGLLLARGARRQREIAIRLALGASRGGIVRHLLTESVLLACAGGALGLLATVWGVDLVAKRLSAQAPFYVDFSLDRMALGYCLFVSLATGLMFGILPALRSSTPDVHTALKLSSPSVRRSALRGLLVIGELALALVLLAGAGVLMKSFLRISAPSGAAADRNVLTGRLEFLDARYRDRTAVRQTLDAVVARIGQIAGVAGAASDRTDFIAGFGGADQPIRVDGRSGVPAGVSPRFYHAVTPGYFAVVGQRIVAGRDLNAADRAGSELVTVINQRMASQLWPSESPLGHRIKLGAADSLPWVTIVGVVTDVADARSRAANYAYVSAEQFPGDRATLLVRARRDPLAFAPSVRAAVGAVDEDLPVVDLQTAAQAHHANYWPYELYAMTMGVFAGLAILLAAIGLYGVIAYDTAQRTREIGVRIALGADTRHVMALVATQGSRLVIVGIVLGIAGSAAMLRALGAMLFGVSPIDLPVFAAVSGLLAVIAMAAILVPARRASRIDPLEALRAE